MASRPTGHGLAHRPPRRSRFAFETRLKLLCAALFVPGTLLSLFLLTRMHASSAVLVAVASAMVLAGWLVAGFLIEQVVRPLQTLSNVVGALREDDFAFRARGAKQSDALGELAHEVNALAETLQERRLGAMEAAALLQRVVEAMDAPVLAVDLEECLRLLNPAAERLFGLEREASLGRTAAELKLAHLLDEPDEGIVVLETGGRPARWMVHRTTFRQRGVPHTLFLLSDVSTALREEERQAWQRLIRVLGHEINNSLAPIKSIAGTLRSHIQRAADSGREASPGELERGLRIIEGRAESLHRFVQAYRRLAQLPAPSMREVALRPLLERTLALETRVEIELAAGPEVSVRVDPDQVEQMMINLLRNAVEAAQMEPGDLNGSSEPEAGRVPEVVLSWELAGGGVRVLVEDNGPGLTNPSNLFVPFYTTKPGGTGVGLALVRQVVEAHGGTVELSNREEGGCRASVTLPWARLLSF